MKGKVVKKEDKAKEPMSMQTKFRLYLAKLRLEALDRLIRKNLEDWERVDTITAYKSTKNANVEIPVRKFVGWERGKKYTGEKLRAIRAKQIEEYNAARGWS